MAQTQYRPNQPTTLLDALSQPQSAPGPAPTASGPPQASNVQDDQLRQRLIDMIFAEEELPPAEPVNAWQQAIGMGLSGLGDAVTAFNAGRTGNPGFQTDFAGQMLRNQQQQAEARRQLEAEFAQKKNRSKREKGAYLLSQMDKEKAEQLNTLQQQAAQADERAYKKQVRTEEAATDLANAVTIKTMEQQAQTQRNRDDNATRLQVERIQERQRVANEGDRGKQKILDEQHGLYLTAKQQIMGNKARWMQDIQNGRDPATVREEWNDFLDAGDLLPEYRASVQAFFDAKIEPLLEKAEQSKFAQTFENQGPTIEQTISPGQIQKARQSTRQGQRY